MAKSLLDQLREITTVVADTGDIHAIELAKPQDATTNPSLVAAAAGQPRYEALVNEVLTTTRGEVGNRGSPQAVAALAAKRLSVAFGTEILRVIPGRVSTEVDPRLSEQQGPMIAQAREIIAMYRAHGVPSERVLVKIASTWEGIRAAAKLETEGIHCNLTLLFGLHQAVACGEANVTLISPFVGRIYDWYKAHTGQDYRGADDPGVQSVTRIYNYFKNMGYKTQIMGASFRNMGQILELAGNDLLTISPGLLAELDSTSGPLVRKLSPERARSTPITRLTIDKEKFDEMHEADQMAKDKLADGIAGFTKSLSTLEDSLTARLSQTC